MPSSMWSVMLSCEALRLNKRGTACAVPQTECGFQILLADQYIRAGMTYRDDIEVADHTAARQDLPSCAVPEHDNELSTFQAAGDPEGEGRYEVRVLLFLIVQFNLEG